jgi:hypothetical protein
MNYLEYLQGIFTGYEVTEESNYNYNGEDTVIVIKYLGGGANYLDSQIQPVQINIYSPDIPAAKTLADAFARGYTNVSFWDDLEYVMQYYSTPTVLSQFQGGGPYPQNQIVINGTLIISSNVSEIKTVKIDTYSYETTMRKLSYTTLEDSQPKNAVYINSTNIKGSILQFTCTMINRNNDICLKARRIRQGTLDKDTAFTIVLTYSDNDIEETYSMKLHSYSLDSENSKLPVIALTFIK